MSKKDKERFNELQKKDNQDKLTKVENVEYENLLKQYKKTKEYKDYFMTGKFAKGGEVTKYKNFEIVVISKELNKDGGRNFKDRMLVSATNVKEAKKIATKLWKERINDESDLMMLDVLTDSELRQSKKYAKGGEVKRQMDYRLTNNDEHNVEAMWLELSKDKSKTRGEIIDAISDELKINWFEISSWIKRNYKTYATGGEVKKISTTSQVKRNLRGSGAFTLELEMAVYVPSTTVADQIIPKTLFQKRIQEVEKYVSKLFGGYSSTSVEGGYVSKEKGLIKEDVAKVTAFGTEESLKKNFKPLMRQISKWCEAWGQESMGFEFEGDLYYVSKDAKFSKGGKIENKPVKPKFVKNARK
jgi:hypothetical protein